MLSNRSLCFSVCSLLQQHFAVCLSLQLFSFISSIFCFFLATYGIKLRKIVCIYVLKLVNGDCGQWIKGKSDVVGEIRTGFLAVFLTSFNFSSPGCDFKNKFKNNYLQNVCGGGRNLGCWFQWWHMVLAWFICLKMQYLMQGTSSLCLRLSVLLMSSLLERSVWLLLFSIFWLPRIACCQDRASLRKHTVKGGLGTWAVLGIL